MRKKLLSLIILLPLLSKAQHQFIAEGGVTSAVFAPPSGTIDNASHTARGSLYGKLGLRLDLGNKFKLDNSIGFISRQYYTSYFVGPDYSGNGLYTVRSLQLQAIFERNILRSDHVELYPGLGLYGGTVLGGRVKYHTSSFIGVTDGIEDLHVGNEPSDDFKKMEAGCIFRLRVQHKQIYFLTSFNLGLTEDRPGTHYKWKTWLFGVGYNFGRKSYPNSSKL